MRARLVKALAADGRSAARSASRRSRPPAAALKPVSSISTKANLTTSCSYTVLCKALSGGRTRGVKGPFTNAACWAWPAGEPKKRKASPEGGAAWKLTGSLKIPGFSLWRAGVRYGCFMTIQPLVVEIRVGGFLLLFFGPKSFSQFFHNFDKIS